jgi:vancomycin resistance protein YoaR
MIAKRKRFHTQFIKFVFIGFGLCIIALSLFLAFIESQEQKLTNKIYPNVFVQDINFGYRNKTYILDHFERKNTDLKQVKFNIFYDNTPIATFSGEKLKLHYDSKGIMDRAYMIGRSSNFSTRIYQKIGALLDSQSYKIDSPIEYDSSVIAEFLSNQEEKYNMPAKNALFSFENGRVTSFRQEEKGLKIESEKFWDSIQAAIRECQIKPKNKTILLASHRIDPETTLAKANSFGIEELIGEGKSDYTHSIPERIHNVILAASKFNGVLIPKGEVFSFNKTLGDVSALTGFKQAYIIKEGRTVLGDGGGVCQVSTTFFRAALYSGLPILERHAHAYRVSYYENDGKPGLDATVFDPSADLKIKNDTPASILIQTEVDQNNNLLYFRFYGKKDGRVAELSPIQVYDIQPPPPDVRQDDPTLKKGQVKQVDFAAWGAKASFNYKVTHDGKVINQQTFFSNYRPWSAVYMVGTAD